MHASCERVLDYALSHLGSVGSGLADVMSEVEELTAHPDRNQRTGDIKARLDFLRHLARQKKAYIQTVAVNIDIFQRTIEPAGWGEAGPDPTK